MSAGGLWLQARASASLARRKHTGGLSENSEGRRESRRNKLKNSRGQGGTAPAMSQHRLFSVLCPSTGPHISESQESPMDGAEVL